MAQESNTDSIRKLASIQVVDTINPHLNSNSLQLATVLGWQIVIRENEVCPGDKVVYCEIDSLLPVTASWLPPAIQARIEQNKITDYFRVKTIKLRGEISQGLIIPLMGDLSSLSELEVGTDVTSRLDIGKYEPPALTGKYSLYTTISGDPFPTGILDKTDEPRIQSRPQLLELLQGNPYYMTVKLDGTSATYLWNTETQELMVCSRNLTRKRPDNLKVCPYWYIAEKYQLENILKEYPYLGIQGEICGPNIQKNLLGLKDLHLFVFNLIDLRTRTRLPFFELMSMCEKLSLPTVPIEQVGDIFPYCTVKELLALAKGHYHNTKNAREGLVVRSIDSSISFKIINNEYLLKYDL